MSRLTISNGGQKLSGKTLRSFENELDVELPSDYREFLLKHNGGDPSKKHFYLRKLDKQTVWVDYFCCVDNYLASASEDADGESISFKHHAYGDVVPDDSLIIGVVCRDDLLLLRIRGRRRGQVAVKVLAELGVPLTSGDWGKNKEKGVHRVAESFKNFLESLGSSQGWD